MSRRPVFSLLVAGLWLVTGSLAACSPAATPSGTPPTSGSSPAAAATVTATVPATPKPLTPAPTAAGPVTFTSTLYRYSVTLPLGWNGVQALLPWDGASAPSDLDPTTDKLHGPVSPGVFVYAAPRTGDLAAFAKDTTSWVVRDHGDTCPTPAPDKTEQIQFGGDPGLLQLWNCGALINLALVVHDGVGYTILVRDLAVPAASDPADRALLDALLAGFTFPS